MPTECWKNADTLIKKWIETNMNVNKPHKKNSFYEVFFITQNYAKM